MTGCAIRLLLRGTPLISAKHRILVLPRRFGLTGHALDPGWGPEYPDKHRGYRTGAVGAARMSDSDSEEQAKENDFDTVSKD